MKLYLASFIQKRNFGPGRIISITNSGKPQDLNVESIFLPLTPPVELIQKYLKIKEIDLKSAGNFFVEIYQSQLDTFVAQVYKVVNETNQTVEEILPFKEGDTLCSWERKEYTHYRGAVALCLERLGYIVVLN